MERPWMKFHTRDWLDNKELRRCSAISRALLADLMCLAHEGEPYGYLADKVGPLTIGYMASRSFMKPAAFTKAIGELVLHGRIAKVDSGAFYIPRLVEDEAFRLKMAESGKRGGNPSLVKGTLNPMDNSEDKHARAPADSGSGSSLGVDFSKKEAIPFVQPKRGVTVLDPVTQRFLEWIAPWPRVADEESALRNWIARVEAGTVQAAFDCRDRYLASDEVSRGIIAEPWKFIVKQADNGWKGKWPSAAEAKARDSPPAGPAFKVSPNQKWRAYDPETLEDMDKPYGA